LAWKIDFDVRVEKDLKKLDRSMQKNIFSYLKDRVANGENPRDMGKPLKANYKGLWRYRVNDYRIICNLEDAKETIFVLAIGHRKNIYSLIDVESSQKQDLSKKII
jgi:mRNA interferase RelE/StbE